MKVGDYVRFDYHRISVPIQIARITEAHYHITDEDDNVCYSTDVGLVISESNLVKEPSPNIMDLIEEGDILKVNDFKDVDTIYEVEMFRNPYINEKYLGIRNDLGSKPKRLYEIPLVNLSIVTHEQFERMQYNLESEVN